MGKVWHLNSSEMLVYAALHPETMSLFGAEEMRPYSLLVAPRSRRRDGRAHP